MKWQVKVAKLGKELHQNAPKCFANFIRRGMRVENCFKRLNLCGESKDLFERLTKTIDDHIEEKSFHEALQLVCRLK